MKVEHSIDFEFSIQLIYRNSLEFFSSRVAIGEPNKHQIMQIYERVNYLQ